MQQAHAKARQRSLAGLAVLRCRRASDPCPLPRRQVRTHVPIVRNLGWPSTDHRALRDGVLRKAVFGPIGSEARQAASCPRAQPQARSAPPRTRLRKQIAEGERKIKVQGSLECVCHPSPRLPRERPSSTPGVRPRSAAPAWDYRRELDQRQMGVDHGETIRRSPLLSPRTEAPMSGSGPLPH